MKGCPVCCFHIINLHKNKQKNGSGKRAARAGLFDVLKNHAFRMSPLRLNRKLLMFGTPRMPSFENKRKVANMT